MKRNQKIKIATVCCSVIALAAAALAFGDLFSFAGGSYAHAEKYTAGEAEIQGTIKHLDVQWVDGAVRIAWHDQDTVLLSETSKKSISDDQRLRWWLDGDTLRVRYAKAGLRLGWGVSLQKELTVTLPKGIALDSAALSATSGDIDAPDLSAGKLELSTTSGDIRLAGQAGELQVSTTSGDQDLKTSGRTAYILLSSTSGNINLEAGDAGTVQAAATSGGVSLKAAGSAESVSLQTTSGPVRADVREAGKLTLSSTSGTIGVLAARAGEVKLGSTSGSIDLSLGQVDKLDVGTTSGAVTAALPALPGMTARVHTVSGRFQTDLAAAKKGDTYTWGDGSASADISTVSGSIQLSASAENGEALR